MIPTRHIAGRHHWWWWDYPTLSMLRARWYAGDRAEIESILREAGSADGPRGPVDEPAAIPERVVSVTSVFVDASAWVAFFNRRGPPTEARETMELLLRTSAPLITSTWTTYESITIVRSKLGYGRARRLWQMANNRRIVTMIRVDPTIESAALKLVWRYRDKEWGGVDCAGIVIMERIGCKTAFGYDRHWHSTPN